MKGNRKFAAQITLAVLLLAGRAAVAGSQEDAQAEALVKRGIELRKDGRDREALEQFRRAYRISPLPKIQAQIGVAEQALGMWIEAEAHLVDAVSARTDAWIQKHRTALEEALETVRSHLGSLEVIGEPAGADVFVEGRRVGTLPLEDPVRLPVGKASVEVRAPGRVPAVREVVVSAGSLSRESVILAPQLGIASNQGAAGNATEFRSATVGESDGTEDEAESPGWHRPMAWALAGSAAVFAGAGIAALWVRESKAQQFNKFVDQGSCVRESDGTFSGPSGTDCGTLREDGRTALGLAIGAFAISAASAVASGVLFLGSSSARSPSQTARVSLACSASPTPARILTCQIVF